MAIRTTKTKTKAWLAFLAAVLLAIPAANAMFMMPQTAPVDRLIKNVTAYTKEHPQDAEGFYTLGRLHYLAFHMNADRVGVYAEEAGKLPRLAPAGLQGRGRADNPPATTLPADQLPDHVREAVINFRKAIEMSPDSALYHLGLASVLNEGTAIADRIGLVPGDELNPDKATIDLAPEAVAKREAEWQSLVTDLGAGNAATRDAATAKLQAAALLAIPFLLKNADLKDPEVHLRVTRILTTYWHSRAIPEYLKAHQLAVADDLKMRTKPLAGMNSLISFEAGTQYTKLIAERPATDAEKDQVAKVEKDLQALKDKPNGPVTPIIFNVDQPAPLADLLLPGAAVPFNLDGTARPQAWTWVKPTTAILVWDPDHTGKITSGHQLFGNVTFNMFWSDGYRALDALDDNRDGVLSGSELAGLALWFDRNADGRADPGEIIPIEKTAIIAIRVQPDTTTSGAPASTRGLILSDGRTLPTYDWLAQPQRKGH